MVNSSNGTHDESGSARRYVLPGPPGMMQTGTTAAGDATPKVEGMEVVRRMLCADGGGGRGEVSSSPQDDDDDDDDVSELACERVLSLTGFVFYPCFSSLFFRFSIDF